MMSRIAVLVSLLLSVAAAKKLYMCGVVTDVDDSFVAPTIFGDDFSNYNAISFGNFYAPSADVEGAAAIKGDLNLPNGGYSFGDLRRTTGPTAIDAPLTASVIVGGNAVYVSGSVQPRVGAKEYIYVGGTFTTSDPGLLDSRYTGASGNQAAAFDAAQDYYTRVSAHFAALPTTIYATRSWSEMRVTCPDASASLWVVSINGDDINQITWWTKNGCSEQAQFVFNVQGSGNVVFSGGEFTHDMELVLWNVIGSGRTVQLSWSEVRGTLLAPNNNYYQPNTGVWKGQIIVANVQQAHQINRQFCPKPPTPVPSSDCVTFETQCAGLSFNLGEASSFVEYNAISFKDFTATTGDIEGRLAARGNVNFGEGYSVGATLSTVNDMPDRHQHYSLIVGGDLAWINGALFPNTLGAVIERAYVAGSSSVPASIADRVDTGSNIDSIFDAAKTCYTGYQSTLKAQADNVKATIADSGLFLTCDSASADAYSVTLAGSVFTSFTYTVTVGCNFQSRWTINVVGSDNVDISGASFPAIPGGTVYNVECTAAGQTVSIHDTQLFGHLLAPNCIVDQPSGVIVGKVVAGDIRRSLQINSMTTCPTPQTVTITLVASQNTVKGSLIVYVKGADSTVRVGDQTSAGKVVGVTGDMIVLDTPLTQDYSAGQVVGTMFVDSTDGRQVIANPTSATESSASVAGIAVVAIAAAALIL